ncbi:MAG: hypothetical protein JNK87_17570 [Bryobacterales bacterium]|nr:hypothetical protein [Bryobacterales bacterium]
MKISSDGQTSLGRRLVLLAASTDLVPAHLNRVRVDAGQHAHLLQAAQRLRGAVYLADGAIAQTDLAPDGRFISRIDQEGWQFLILGQDDEVRGTIRYRPIAQPARFEHLGLSQSSLARDRDWALALRRAVESEFERAAQRDLQYIEVGGWAMGKELRNTTEGLRLALTSFALAMVSGGAFGIVNATQRHNSAQILRKVGGSPLQWQGVDLPPYFDQRYRCQMEILRFDSDHLQPRLAQSVSILAESLAKVEVVAARRGISSSLNNLWTAVNDTEAVSASPKRMVAHAR